jgi:hypothetical protein
VIGLRQTFSLCMSFHLKLLCSLEIFKKASVYGRRDPPRYRSTFFEIKNSRYPDREEETFGFILSCLGIWFTVLLVAYPLRVDNINCRSWGCSVAESNRKTVVIWLILPVVIRSSQRLSHACLSINDSILWNCEWLIISVIVYLIVFYYLDNRSNSRANTCYKT